MTRKRQRLVPRDAVECFEIRVVLYFNSDGDSVISWDVSTPDDPAPDVSLHELVGVLEFGKSAIVADYFEVSE